MCGCGFGAERPPGSGVLARGSAAAFTCGVLRPAVKVEVVELPHSSSLPLSVLAVCCGSAFQSGWAVGLSRTVLLPFCFLLSCSVGSARPPSGCRVPKCSSLP